MSLPPDISAMIGARKSGLGIAWLIKFDFTSVTKRVWTGFGDLKTLDVNIWSGLGEVVSIDGLSQLSNAAATSGTLTVSGVSPDLLAKAIGEEQEFLQQPVSFYLQAFQGRAVAFDACPLGTRIMTGMQISRTGDTRSIAITHESPYIGRNVGASGFYTDQDQQRRFPGDRACERTPYLVFKRESWPAY